MEARTEHHPPEALVQACAAKLDAEMGADLVELYTSEQIAAACLNATRHVLRAALATGQVVLVGDEWEWRVLYGHGGCSQSTGSLDAAVDWQARANKTAHQAPAQLQRRRVMPEAPWEPVDP